MSDSQAPVKADHLNEISDSIAVMVACILQEQLAPIQEAIREHSKLLDWHSALLNHSTVMNRYNVGKLDDLRDLQTNVNYKLQFHIDPEDRRRPTFCGLQPTISAPTSAIINSSSVSSRDRTESPSGTSSVTSAPDPPTRQPTPVFETPPTPPQVAADGCGAPTTRRGLRRERAHDEIPDPMRNSSRKIDLSKPLPTPAPPPLYVPPPICTDRVLAARRSETSEASASQSPPSFSTTVAGKKRKREDNAPFCASEARIDTSHSGTVCDEPERKRKKDATVISTERIPIPESFLRLARLNIFGEPSFEERRCEVEQMRYMRNLFRGGTT